MARTKKKSGKKLKAGKKAAYSKRGTADRSSAILTILDAEGLGKKGRANIAAWLRRNANSLIKDGDNYADLFRSRYMLI